MSDALATAEAPPRRRDTWSIRRIAEEIGGRPIAEFQNAEANPHLAPYRSPVTETLPPRSAGRGPNGRSPGAGSGRGDRAEGATEEIDPVSRIYPPLTRGTGRALHGADRIHHEPTLAAMRGDPEPPEPGRASHRPGPSTRPERIYLHYLLLHLDRLSDHALAYLQHAVREEIEARSAPPP